MPRTASNLQKSPTGVKAMDGKSKQADISYQKGQLIGQYKILEILKQEQLADTYLGKGIEDKIPVMIKVPRPPLISELEKNFLMHGRVLMEMKHPHILRMRDVGLDNHNPFLVTDYVSHVTLRQVFPAGSVQPLVTFLPYLKQIASALQYAHGRHILHGDIRLENALLNKDDQILLTDFAIEEIIQNRERFN
jgi:serine/threonine protein kinase